MQRSWRMNLGGAVLAAGMAATAWAEEEQAETSGEITVKAFDHFVVQGGWITWFILIPISVAMVALVIDYVIVIRRKRIIPPDFLQRIQDLFSQKRYRDAMDSAGADPSDLAFVIHAALSQAPNGYGAMERALEEAAEERTSHLLRKIEMLNIVGQISPMIGLFGTIVGMIVAFQTLVALGGQPDPAKLAYGISVALVTTFWGLLIAIPALTAYAIFKNRIDGLISECALITDDLLAVFRPGVGRPAGGPTPPVPAPPKPAPTPQPTPQR